MATNWSQTAQHILPEDRQKALGRPLAHPQGFSPEDEAFLNHVTDLIDRKKIDLHLPSSLLNHAVYDTLPGQLQGKADQQAMLLLTKVREIYWLWKTYQEPTFQIMNLIHACRLYTEGIEAASGDVFIL